MSAKKDLEAYRIRDGVTERLCSGCGSWFPYTPAYFYTNGPRLQTTCKPCMRARSRRRTEQVRAHHKQMRQFAKHHLEKGKRRNV